MTRPVARAAAAVSGHLLRWADSYRDPGATPRLGARRIEPLRVAPFIALHPACLAVLWAGWSPTALGVAAFTYVSRMFAITAFYHRYFAHRCFRASRGWQLAFALAGLSAAQRGPLWWAAQHRRHHRHADTDADPHSPLRHGFWWSHVGWCMSADAARPRHDLVPDLARFPELVLVDRFHAVVPLLLAAALFALGEWLAARAPSLGTDGPQLLVWGFVVSTVALFHATFCINSVAHLVGRRRHDTPDGSRNNAVLAVLTLGEGWHNNHHRDPGCARQGWRRGEPDPTFAVLRLLERAGIISGLRDRPRSPARGAGRAAHGDVGSRTSQRIGRDDGCGGP